MAEVLQLSTIVISLSYMVDGSAANPLQTQQVYRLLEHDPIASVLVILRSIVYSSRFARALCRDTNQSSGWF